jgi:hypothetical protein
MEFQGPKVVKVRVAGKAGYFGLKHYPKSTTVLSCQLGKTGYKLITKLTPEEKKGALRLLGTIKESGVTVDDMTEDMASNQLFIALEKDPKNFFDIMTDKELKTKAWIYELVE